MQMGRPKTKHKDMPDGMTQISGIWYWRATNAAVLDIALRLFGKRQVSTQTKDKAAARLWWGKTIAPALDNLYATADAAGTVRQLLLRWQAEALPNVASPATREYYGNLLPGLLIAFGAHAYAQTEAQAMRGGTLRSLHIQRYLSEQCAPVTRTRADGREVTAPRPKIANREVKLLAMIFDHARNVWGLTEYNPARGVKFNAEPARDAYIDDALYARAYDAASPTLRCMAALGTMTGARIGSLRKIMLADITADVVHITPNKIKAGARAVKRPYKLFEWDDDNKVFVRNDLGRAIDEALALRKTACGSGNVFKLPAQSPLFLNNKGEAWTKSGFDSAWERCLEKAGIERGTFHFHDLRGKAGTDSATLADAQQLLGHTDSKTTARVYRRKQGPITPLASPKAKRA